MLVGRDSEITQLEEVLREGKHALVAISSKPGISRLALLQELRSHAENMSWRVLPDVSMEEKSPGAVSISRDTTECDFLENISFRLRHDLKAPDTLIQETSSYRKPVVPESAEDEPGKKGVSVLSAQSAEIVFQPSDIKQGALQERANVLLPSGKPRPTTEVGKVLGGTLILIDTYQPSEEFETRFLQHCIPEMKRATSPLVIVVAGYSGDLVALSEFADLKIVLEPLPTWETTEYFRNLNDAIEDKMEEKEIEAYANASANDPSLIEALTRLLVLK